jgi:hypothetical protein
MWYDEDALPSETQAWAGNRIGIIGRKTLHPSEFARPFPFMANALATEKSPYLLQHAGNPVQWLPWGEAAFAKARLEQKPIFLSIGYSTCHWCHVMAHESFENEDVAALLNEYFVSIKVDREERPDVDKVYMSYVQALTGHVADPGTEALFWRHVFSARGSTGSRGISVHVESYRQGLGG